MFIKSFLIVFFFTTKTLLHLPMERKDSFDDDHVLSKS